MKKKILLFCDFYLPSVKAGGPLRSIATIIDCLKTQSDVLVVTRNHDLNESRPYEDIEPNRLYQRDGYQIIYFLPNKIVSSVRDLLQKNQFDVIYLNSFFSPKMSIFTLLTFKLLKIKNTRVIISPRGEFGLGALFIKKPRKKIFLFLFRHLVKNNFIEWHATSDQEGIEIKNVIGKNANVTVLPNLVSHALLHEPVNNKKTNYLNMVFLSRICKKKNLHYALESLATVKGNVTLDIYGLIQEPDYWQVCLDIIKKLPNHIQVKYCGECDPSLVLTTLKEYDLFILPTLNENYGHVIVESLAAGCPVLLSDQTPWHDLSKHNAGWEYSLSQPEKFVRKIDELVLMNTEKYEQYKNAALDYYKNNIMNDVLENKYQEFFIGRRDAIYRVSEGLT